MDVPVRMRDTRIAQLAPRCCRRFDLSNRSCRKYVGNTFAIAFKTFESTKRACHHDRVFISEIHVLRIQSAEPLRDRTSRTHIFTFCLFSFFSYFSLFLHEKDKGNWPSKMLTRRIGHESSRRKSAYVHRLLLLMNYPSPTKLAYIRETRMRLRIWYDFVLG